MRHQADENSPLYYTVAPCGCTKMLIADMPEHAKDTAKELGAAIRRGERVERGIARDVWNGTIALGFCPICDPPARNKRKHNSAVSAELRKLAAWNNGEKIR